MRKYVIDNWRRAHRMASMWIAALAGGYSQLTESQQIAVLKLLHVSEADLLGYVALAFIAARLVKQPAASQPSQ